MHTKFWSESLNGMVYLEDLHKDERIISDGAQTNRVGRCGLDASWLSIGTSDRLL
jgi:hypothetical protein